MRSLALSRHRNSSSCILVLLASLLFLVSGTTANADVDMVGRLEKAGSRSLKSGVQPLSVSSENGDWRCADPYSTVANWPYYYAVGNCPNGAELEVVSYASENPATHEHSYGGFVNGSFSGCGWINTQFPLEKLNSSKHTACAEEAGGGFKVKEATFWEKVNSTSAQDGFYVVNKVPCPEYANYRPWSESNAPKELLRTVPAYEKEGLGSGTRNPALKWRYVSKYASTTEPKVKYVMVRDDRIGGGEGNWVFVPRSCLPATLPTSEGELLPFPPTVTTESASGVATPGATLHATVNPNGVATKFTFQYGTTTSYGLETPAGEAGAGTNNMAVQATVANLSAGTTYYYRIVASSATGESIGSPVTFTTQPPPTVTTSVAANVEVEQATLEGNVNPNGLEAKYHFEYGETTSYGSVTPNGEAGTGTSAVPVSATVTGLKPGTMYHYKLVATSAAGEARGSDGTFTTLGDSHPAVVHEAAGNGWWVYYQGSNGALMEYSLSGSTWTESQIGGHMAPGTSPVVVHEAAGNGWWVYYQGSNGALMEYSRVGATWTESEIGGSMAPFTDPATVHESGHNEFAVFYEGSNNGLWQYTFNGTMWSDYEIGGAMAP
jgi:Fungal fucose-specific lectin